MNGPSRHRSAGVIAGVALLAMGGPGLAGRVADKTGSETVTLHLATIDGEVNPSGMFNAQQVFLDSLESVSDGQLQVDVTTNYGDGAADAESKLVESIASGALDGGWPATRAFADAGIDGLQAVEAPMTITNYAAEKELVSSSTAETVLAQLDGSGVVGLGLSVGPLRRPFAAEAPLLAPADWRGARFRVFNSPVQTDVVTALGGEPANLGFGWTDQLDAGELRGGEFDIGQYSASGLTTEAGFVTSNVVLWPKVFVLSMSQERFDPSPTSNAVGSPRPPSWRPKPPSTRPTTKRRLPASSATRVLASSPPTPERSMRSARRSHPSSTSWRPIARGATLLADVQAIAERHPDTEVPDVPESCQQSSSATVDTASIPDGRPRYPMASIASRSAWMTCRRPGSATSRLDRHLDARGIERDLRHHVPPARPADHRLRAQ